MSLSALPNELLNQICSYLEEPVDSTEPYHLGGFRLACKLFAAIGLRHLAREITLSVTPWSISRLLRLSSGKRNLRRNVRSLRISCFMYPTPLENDCTLKYFWEGSELSDSPSAPCPDTLEAYYAYRSLCCQQKRLTKSNQYFDCLKTLLQRLPNLQRITIFDTRTKEIIPRNMEV